MMRPYRTQMILSLTDMAHVIKRGWNIIFLSALLFGCASFIFFLTRPIHFTAKGIFNGHSPSSSNAMAKAFEFLAKEEMPLSTIDQRTLMHSYPVLEAVVRKLNLQAALVQKQRKARLREVWYTFKTAKAYQRIKKQQPASYILNPSIPTSGHVVIPDSDRVVRCINSDFSLEIFQVLKINFLDALTYHVKLQNKIIGIGQLGTPFVWNGGAFTLAGTAKKNDLFWLHLIPMEAAVESLQRHIKVVKNKENGSLIDVSYTHRDRHLATSIVNETMEQLQIFLMQEATNRIKKQIQYLQQRQEETLAKLECILDQQKRQLINDIDAGIVITLQKELEFMAKQQAEKKESLLQIGSEILNLWHMLHNLPLTLDKVLDELRSHKQTSTLQSLSVESARELITRHQQELDLVRLDHERYDFCLSRMAESASASIEINENGDFNTSSLSKTLDDQTLKKQFENICTLQRQLIDEKNWTIKEREQLKEELETEKRFIMQHIRYLKNGAMLHEKVLEERIAVLQSHLLYLLFDRYVQTEAALEEIKKQATHFPQKWLNEQKLEIHTKLYGDMVTSITKIVEAKNLGYHLHYLMANILKKATPPLFPDHPHLLRGTLIGIFTGAFLTLLSFVCYQAWHGPTASSDNLSSQGKCVVPTESEIAFLGLKISEKGQIVLAVSSSDFPSIQPLFEWLVKKGEKVFLLDLDSENLDPNAREADLCSMRFKTSLSSLKETHDRVLVVGKGVRSKLELEILTGYADTIIYYVSENERLQDLESLPASTLFCVINQRFPIYSLYAVKPILDILLKRFSFSSFRSALKWFHIKRS